MTDTTPATPEDPNAALRAEVDALRVQVAEAEAAQSAGLTEANADVQADALTKERDMLQAQLDAMTAPPPPPPEAPAEELPAPEAPAPPDAPEAAAAPEGDASN